MDFIDFGLYLTYFLSGVAFVGMLVFIFKDMFSNIASSKFMLIGLVAVVVIFFLGYSVFAGDNSAFIRKYDLTENTVKLVSGGLFTWAVLNITAFVLMIGDIVSGIFKGN